MGEQSSNHVTQFQEVKDAFSNTLFYNYYRFYSYSVKQIKEN